jgi:hypothetical protein
MNDFINLLESEQEYNKVLAAQKKRMTEAAERYIAADRTDPFTRARVYSHMRNGVSTNTRGSNPDSQLSSFYDAERYSEKRVYVADGVEVEYTVPAYRSMVRP